MENKSLIIGASVNYNYNQLKPWVESLDEVGFEGDKVLIIGNTDTQTIQQLADKGFTLIDVGDTPKNSPIHVLRFLYIYDYLKDKYKDYEFVITTDVKDVYFQRNPVDYLFNVCWERDYNFPNLVVGSESLKYKDEPWGNDNLLQTFGSYIYEEFKEKEIYNVGVIGGASEYVKDLCLQLYLNSINRPIPIVDQAVFNVMIQSQPYFDQTHFACQYDAWACHAGTTVDPSKIANFRPNLLEPEPYFEDGVVYTSTGEPFYIVHQYDRVPEWKEYVRTKFNQEDTEKYFIYRTA